MDPSNPRRDIEKFLAMGGGSFDALLDMLGGEREPETPQAETKRQIRQAASRHAWQRPFTTAGSSMEIGDGQPWALSFSATRGAK